MATKEFHLKPKEIRPTGKILGRGSFGEVIEVKWQGKLYAAKRMHEIFLTGIPKPQIDKMVKDFEREWQTWLDLKHPNIVNLLGIYYPPKSSVPVFLLEKMDTSLRHYLDNHSKAVFLLQDKVHILLQVAEGLCHLHDHDPPLVHHDLSPNNILLNENSLQTKLTDFGMTRAINLSTRQSSVKGTPVFMPPEAFEEPLHYNEKLDVFSYGNCIVTTLTHEWPDPSYQTVQDGDRLVAVTEYERRKSQIDQMSDRERRLFLDLIKRCLANSADSRPSSAEIVSEMKLIHSTLPRPKPPAYNRVHQAISHPSQKREYTFQIVVIGDTAVGRTCIIDRYVNANFRSNPMATILLSFAITKLNLDANTIVTLNIWELNGLQRSNASYFKFANGAIVVFDLSNPKLYEAKLRKKHLDNTCLSMYGSTIPAILLGNKCDRPGATDSFNTSQMEDFCKKNNFLSYFPTSAKEDIGINEAFKFLVTQLVEIEDQQKGQNYHKDTINQGVHLGATESSSVDKRTSCTIA